MAVTQGFGPTYVTFLDGYTGRMRFRYRSRGDQALGPTFSPSGEQAALLDTRTITPNTEDYTSDLVMLDIRRNQRNLSTPRVLWRRKNVDTGEIVFAPSAVFLKTGHGSKLAPANLLLTADTENYGPLCVYRADTGQRLWKADLGPIGEAAFTKDAQFIAVRSAPDRMALLDAVTGRPIWTGHFGREVRLMGVSSNGGRIAVLLAGSDGGPNELRFVNTWVPRATRAANADSGSGRGILVPRDIHSTLSMAATTANTSAAPAAKLDASGFWEYLVLSPNGDRATLLGEADGVRILRGIESAQPVQISGAMGAQPARPWKSDWVRQAPSGNRLELNRIDASIDGRLLLSCLAGASETFYWVNPVTGTISASALMTPGASTDWWLSRFGRNLVTVTHSAVRLYRTPVPIRNVRQGSGDGPPPVVQYVKPSCRRRPTSGSGETKKLAPAKAPVQRLSLTARLRRLVPAGDDLCGAWQADLIGKATKRSHPSNGDKQWVLFSKERVRLQNDGASIRIYDVKPGKAPVLMWEDRQTEAFNGFLEGSGVYMNLTDTGRPAILAQRQCSGHQGAFVDIIDYDPAARKFRYIYRSTDNAIDLPDNLQNNYPQAFYRPSTTLHQIEVLDPDKSGVSPLALGEAFQSSGGVYYPPAIFRWSAKVQHFVRVDPEYPSYYARCADDYSDRIITAMHLKPSPAPLYERIPAAILAKQPVDARNTVACLAQALAYARKFREAEATALWLRDAYGLHLIPLTGPLTSDEDAAFLDVRIARVETQSEVQREDEARYPLPQVIDPLASALVGEGKEDQALRLYLQEDAALHDALEDASAQARMRKQVHHEAREDLAAERKLRGIRTPLPIMPSDSL